MKKQQVYIWIKNNLFTQCILCLGSNPHPDTQLCGGCEADLPWQQACCQRCALPLPHPAQQCGRCLNAPPPFSHALAPLIYRFPVDSLIPAFKYHGQTSIGRLLGQLLAEAAADWLQQDIAPCPDLLLPVPMHRKRQAQRGYNQACELARDIARRTQLRCRPELLERTRSTLPQQGLDAKARRQNLRGAFSCPRPEHLQGKHLALIDDVMTTGVTLSEASQTLLKAGAASVQVWCVARTP